MEWITENWSMIATGLGILLAIASFITGFTSNTIDDTIVGWLQRILQQFSAVQPRDSEGTFKLPGASPAPIASPKKDDKPAGGKAESQEEGIFRPLDDE